MRYKLILRSRGGISMVTVLALMIVVFMVLVIIFDGPLQALRVVLAPVAALFLAWWGWAWPRVELSESGIVIQNQLRTIILPWRTVRSAETKYGLQVYATDKAGSPPKRFFAAGVPARGGFSQTFGGKKIVAPAYKFTKGPTETAFIDPAMAARIIKDEIYYHKKPKERPALLEGTAQILNEHAGAGKSSDSQWKSDFQSRIVVKRNWNMVAWQVGLIAAAVLLAIIIP